MKFKTLILSIRRNKGKWSINLGGSFNSRYITGLENKEETEKLAMLFREIYQAGKFAEFKENNARSKNMMKKWGL